MMWHGQVNAVLAVQQYKAPLWAICHVVAQQVGFRSFYEGNSKVLAQVRGKGVFNFLAKKKMGEKGGFAISSRKIGYTKLASFH